MADRETLKNKVCEVIDQHGERIVGLGETIMDNPELGFKEHKTAQRVKDELNELGLSFEDELALTGVKAVLRGKKPGPTIALMGELDSLILPDHPRANAATGAAHACGHNAQIAGLMGAAIGLTKAGVAEDLSGNIVFFAIPAEEYVEIDYRASLVKEGKTTFLGGKPELVKLGHFEDVDMAVMIHTSSPEMSDGSIGVGVSSNGFLAKTIRFLGRATHAGVSPEKGANALSAAQLALNGIDAQRSTFRDQDWVRVHPIITKGGDIVNIVPAEVCMETYVRAKSQEAIEDAAYKVDRAVRGAAMALGCQVEIETVPGYMPLNNDRELAKLFKENAARIFGQDAYRDYPHSAGSTDAGDLSQLMPVLHPSMTGGKGSLHGIDWHISQPDQGYMAPAKTLAMMAVDLLAEDATQGKEVKEKSRPAMTRQQYLKVQEKIFNREVFDGVSATSL